VKRPQRRSFSLPEAVQAPTPAQAHRKAPGRSKSSPTGAMYSATQPEFDASDERLIDFLVEEALTAWRTKTKTS
jgi:hypothetical protein